MKQILSRASIVVTAIALIAGVSLVAAGEEQDQQAEQTVFSNRDLMGGYAFQSTGTTNYPEPFAALSGPFADNGRAWFNGKGQLTLQVVYNFNGQIIRSQSEGTYEVERDGTFTINFIFQEVGLPTVSLSFDGVLAKGGKEYRLIMTGQSITGLPLPPGYVPGVIVTTATKQ